MARTFTLRDKVRKIIRAYKYISPKKFLYNKKSDLKKRPARIAVWFLLNAEERGYSIMRMEFKRKPASISQWVQLFNKPIREYKNSIYTVLTQAVLPAIEEKGGNSWKFVSMLAWAAVDDLRQGKDRTAPRKHKTTKKRRANASNSRRR